MRKIFFNVFCKYILEPIKGKVAYQAMFERLYEISLKGMNYGNGTDFISNGEFQALHYIKNSLQFKSKPLRIFDVGANTGTYVKLLYEVFDKDKLEVNCFEPSMPSFEILKKNYADERNIIVYNIGMSDKAELVKLYKTEKYSELSSLFQRRLDHFSIEMNQVEEIKVGTIDDFCTEKGINEIDFLKIDVEGNELNVLKGAYRMMSEDKISYIQFEFGGTGIDSKTYFQDFFYLLKDKYRLYRIVKDGLFLIKNYKETNEIFCQVNYIAEHKLLTSNIS